MKPRFIIGAIGIGLLAYTFSLSHGRDAGEVIFVIVTGRESISDALKPVPKPDITYHYGH